MRGLWLLLVCLAYAQQNGASEDDKGPYFSARHELRNGKGFVLLETDEKVLESHVQSPAQDWENGQVLSFLQELGFEEFIPNFRDAGVTGNELMSLTTGDMQSLLGITKRQKAKMMHNLFSKLRTLSFKMIHHPNSFFERKEEVSKQSALKTVWPKKKKTVSIDKKFSSGLMHVCLFSDRIPGLLGTLGSISMNTAEPENVVVWIVTTNSTAIDQCKKHSLWDSKISKMKINVLKLEDVVHSLVEQGIKPVWKWDEYTSSVADKNAWKTKYTVQQGSWDHSTMHYHPLNHLRFYISKFPQFKDFDRVLFVDDDIIVQGDLRQAWAARVSSQKAIVAACGMWDWDHETQLFSNDGKLQPLSDSAALVLVGRTAHETRCPTKLKSNACVNPEVWALIKSLSEKINKETLDLEHTHEWNFGFTLFNLKSWRNIGITRRYEEWMKANYKYHIFPENSLTYGLGLPFLAFLQHADCWDQTSNLDVRDGLGFINFEEFKYSGLDADMLKTSYVLHYDGFAKPWSPSGDKLLSQPYHWTMQGLDNDHYRYLSSFVEVSNSKPTPFLFLTEERSGGNWFIKRLDQHPEICATGEDFNPRFGFPHDAARPYPWSGISRKEPQLRAGCSFGFLARWAQKIRRNGGKECTENGVWPSDMRIHRERICNFYNKLPKGAYLTNKGMYEVYWNSLLNLDSSTLPCQCPGQTKSLMVKHLTTWMRYKPTLAEIDMYELLGKSGTNVVLFTRANRFHQFISGEIAREAKVKQAIDEVDMATINSTRITIDNPKMLEEIRSLSVRLNYIRQQLKFHGVKVLELKYEYCVEHVEECQAKVQKFTKVKVQKNFAKDTTMKSVSEAPEHYIRNYKYVEKYLVDNKLGKYVNTGSQLVHSSSFLEQDSSDFHNSGKQSHLYHLHRIHDRTRYDERDPVENHYDTY